jgi:hypothetical protein
VFVRDVTGEDNIVVGVEKDRWVCTLHRHTEELDRTGHTTHTTHHTAHTDLWDVEEGLCESAQGDQHHTQCGHFGEGCFGTAH